MTVIAYRYRAYPNAVQRELFARHFGCKRKVFNFYLEEAHRLFQKTGSILGLCLHQETPGDEADAGT